MANAPLVLAIDQGTTNTKAVLVDAHGAIVGQASQAMAIEYPRPGWVQQDATAIWEGVRSCVAAVIASAGFPALAGIGISNQRESGVAWEASGGRPVGPVVTWQCRRSADLCDRLRSAGRAPEGVQRQAGSSLDLLRLICKVGFEHHCAMSPAHTADAVAEALENYLGWEVFRHA